MASVAVVSVHYYENYVQPSCAAACRLAALAKAERLVFVANRPGLSSAIRRRCADAGFFGEVSVLEHDNSGAEFGAYQAGLRSLLPALPAWVIFVNDTFSLHQSFSVVYRRKLLDCIANVDGSPAHAVGQTESLPTGFSILGRKTNRWLTTNVFALNRAAIIALNKQLYHPELDALINATDRPDAFFSSQIDPALANHVSAWLFGKPGAKPYETWYGAEPLDRSNAARFAFKARAILQEKYLAAALVEAGTRLVEVRDSNLAERLVSKIERVLHRVRRRRWRMT